jgi:hypothetical protein
VTQRVYFLEVELLAACQAREAVEEKLPSLVDNAAAADRRWVATEKQCKRLVNELTLLHLRESELCMTTTRAPQRPPCTRECDL